MTRNTRYWLLAAIGHVASSNDTLMNIKGSFELAACPMAAMTPTAPLITGGGQQRNVSPDEVETMIHES